MKPPVFTLLLLVASSLSAQRLPQSTIPSHYKISLDPSIGEKKFSGEETIDVRVSTSAKEIVLNSLDLDINDAEVVSGGKAQKTNVVYDKPEEIVRLQFADSLPAGMAQVHLKFTGKLNEGLRGLYLSKSPKRAYAVTQFEGTYARMMFPCFDEPGFKAIFDLTVSADTGDTAISNGRILRDVPLPGNRHQISFSTSPKMSPYLVAVAIGDWQCLSRTVEGVPIRVCAVPDKAQYAAFALDVATHSIEFYNKWYGIKYPFGKLDMLAIPDYEWGGMENTASIFYRDSVLLLDEKNASVLRKRQQAMTIAHEIAHQWFGDLVTAAWWDDIWLNEGFATWMARKPIDAWHPEWHLEDDAAGEAQRVIGVDSLASARAIHGEASTPSEIKEMFDGITYQKGGAVLRMLESYMGAEVFRKGVNSYLRAHANGNATAADFWAAETEASGKPIDEIMPTFVMQPGVPLLEVSSRSCNAGMRSIDFKQQRFLISAGRQGTQDALWQIPVCTKSDVNTGATCTLITKAQQTDSIPGCATWTFANRDAKGYYRVKYGADDLKKISSIAEQQLNVPERIALVEDVWAMSFAGKTQVSSFLDLTTALRDEQNRNVVDLLANHLHELAQSLVAANDQPRFESFLKAQFTPLAREVGWTSAAADSEERKALRASLLDLLGTAGDQVAIATARKLVGRYIGEPGSVEGTLIGSALMVAAQNGDHSLYDQFVDALSHSQLRSGEYYHYLFALTEFRQPQLLERTISFVEQGKVRQQDYPRFFGALLSNSAARDLTWKYLKAHWEDLAQKVTTFGGAGAVSALGSACSQDMRDDVTQFFATHRAPGAQRAVQQSVQRINSCLEFKRAQGKVVSEWLAEQR